MYLHECPVRAHQMNLNQRLADLVDHGPLHCDAIESHQSVACRKLMWLPVIYLKYERPENADRFPEEWQQPIKEMGRSRSPATVRMM